MLEAWADAWHPTAQSAKWIAKEPMCQAFGARLISATCLPLAILLADGWNHVGDEAGGMGGALTKGCAQKWEAYVDSRRGLVNTTTVAEIQGLRNLANK